MTVERALLLVTLVPAVVWAFARVRAERLRVQRLRGGSDEWRRFADALGRLTEQKEEP